MKHPKKRRTLKALIIIAVLIAAIALGRFAILKSTRVTAAPAPEDTSSYTEEERIVTAMALNFLTYGLERAETEAVTVAEILDTETMGIIAENADVVRTDPEDPASAVIDTAGFIRAAAGDFRLLDTLHSPFAFFGAVFADDARRTVWIAYAGATTSTDNIACLRLALGAGLSQQEKNAFELYERALNTPEAALGYSVILTGHSLGGAFASMISYTSGARAITISGACRLGIDKIRRIAEPASPLPVIDNYLTDPAGAKLSFRNLIQRAMFLGRSDLPTYHALAPGGNTTDTHSIFGFILTDGTETALPKVK